MAPTLDPMVGRYVRLDIDGIPHRVYFEEAGPPDGGGIPLVCLHTAGADNRQFRHLLADPVFRALIEGASADARIVRVKNTKSIVTAWEAATAAGEVPRYTWDPPNRIYARPDQAFRAALQAHMTNERMPPDVVSHLVGHARTKDASEKLREIHYGRSLEEHARTAVDDLPPVDWTGAQFPDGVVRFEAHARPG